jgi:hypothetical protein
MLHRIGLLNTSSGGCPNQQVECRTNALKGSWSFEAIWVKYHETFLNHQMKYASFFRRFSLIPDKSR